MRISREKGSDAGGPGTSELQRLSDRLTGALRAVIRGSTLEGLGPIEVARTLAIDKSLASRLMTALRATDPLEALSTLPGTGPMRRFVHAAREHGASVRATEAAERLVRDFERTLQRTFGTRTHLDAALSDALPEARKRQQDAARQSVYRGMALLKGVSIDLVSNTWIVHPGMGGRGSGRVDIRFMAAFIGVRRFRPTARVQFVTSHASRAPGAPAALLREFCRPRDLSVSMHRSGRMTTYEASSLPIGREAAADVYFAEFFPDGGRRSPRGNGPRPTFGDMVSHPYKRLALNMLVHRDAWPGCSFSLRAYDAASRGHVNLDDSSREADRLPVDEAIQQHDVSARALRSSPVPRYESVLRHVIAPMKWDLDEFRMFSCEFVYPLYGSHVMMVLEP